LVENCAGYLTENGLFVTVGIAFDEYTYPSMLHAVFQMLKNVVLPCWIGGAPRRYVQAASFVDQDRLHRLKRFCEEGTLRVHIDSRWGFEDAPKEGLVQAWCFESYADGFNQAYDRMLSRRAKGKIIVRVQASSSPEMTTE
jgi:NADPH:quinone reductase-like Zn-dependent oxidoreductase